jgi:hypothetical protein
MVSHIIEINEKMKWTELVNLTRTYSRFRFAGESMLPISARENAFFGE